MIKRRLMIAAILITILTAGFYTFIIKCGASKNTDGRTTITLNKTERALVLQEMRAFLSSVQQISQGISDDDMEMVEQHARLSGRAAQAGMPVTLVKKLPMPFKKLGGDTHARFDQLAMDAADLADRDHALEQLSSLMKNCVSCHAAYRIDI